MILSFHPCIVADENIICAGRNPGGGDLAAIRSAKAVILPQGCSQALYEMARKNCRNVFPNYDARFQYPGKIGQIRLMRRFQAAHPRSMLFSDLSAFRSRIKSGLEPGFGHERHSADLTFPLVLKFNWGGEGDTVHLVSNSEDLVRLLERAANYEKSGQRGFLIQEYIPSNNRVLRVVAVGGRFISYWRVQTDPQAFSTALARGGAVDGKSDPQLQGPARQAVGHFCNATGINLAGFDLLFRSDATHPRPLFLEINYYFGRHALGGSQRWYPMLADQINRWMRESGLNRENAVTYTA